MTCTRTFVDNRTLTCEGGNGITRLTSATGCEVGDVVVPDPILRNLVGGDEEAPEHHHAQVLS